MLTGDHPLTAVSIAHSSGLIDSTLNPVIISNTDSTEITSKLFPIIDSEESTDSVIVVTGDCLSYITNPDKKGLYKVFKMACEKAKCFIGCRVSPKQKAEIVLMMKEINPNCCTLAIGDGANDVNMITSADVGIGIQGVEGTQAARASDYSIGQFSFLRRLLLIHGRESYRKNSFAVGYMLWKNFLYVLPNVFFGFSSQFTGINLYDPFIDIFYNLLFTAYPIGWFSVADKEFQYKILERLPTMYTPGIKSQYFNKMVFWRWYLYSFVLGGLIYWNATNVFFNSISNRHEMVDFSALGAAIYFNIVFFVNFKLLISTHSHEYMSLALQVFSVGSYFVVLFVTSHFLLFQTFGNWEILLKSIIFALEGILIIFVGLLMEYAWRSLNFFLYEVFIRQKSKDEYIPNLPEKEEEIIYSHQLSDGDEIDIQDEQSSNSDKEKKLDEVDIILLKKETDKYRLSKHVDDENDDKKNYLERRSCKLIYF